MQKVSAWLAALTCCLVVGSAFGKKPAKQTIPSNGLTSVVLLFDRTTGVTKEESNSQVVVPIASITKVMTAYVVLESKAPLDEVITVTPQKIEHSRVLASGMRITRLELLHLALIASDNLAAKLLAVAHPGGYDDFIYMMNRTASRLEMYQTTFIEPTGLLPNTSTARDLLKLNAAASKYSIFTDAGMSKVATQSAQTKKGLWQKLVIRNTSIFAGEYDIRVGKTGLTSIAGWCITMQIRHKGQEFDLIVLGAPTKEIRTKMVLERLRDHMSSFTAKSVIQKFTEDEEENGI